MKTTLSKLAFLGAIASCLAAVNPSDLVKVTNDTTQKCVEYYTYKGDMYCSTKALAPQKIDPAIKGYETQTIVFDDRPWQAAWGKKTAEEVIIEYVTMGEDINNWNELITSQVFYGIQEQVTPNEFANYVIDSIEKKGFKAKVAFLSSTPDAVVFEFRIDSPESQIQDELQKVTKGKEGLYVLHYVVKKADMGSVNREKWLKNLLASKIK